MRILLHCNGGPSIGVGHLARVLALAEEASRAGHDLVLAGDLSGSLVDRLATVTPIMIRPVRRGDHDGLRAVAAELAPDVVHLDTYDVVPTSWPSSALVSSVEDGVFGRRAADVVLDPNLGAEMTGRPGPPPMALLRGARYALLRSEVRARRGEWRLRPEPRAVLVVMGGADHSGLTLRVVEALARTGLELSVTLVMPTEKSDAVSRVASGRMRVRIIPPVADLAELAVSHDLVVSASGTTVWELCHLGVPMALVPVVDNQLVGFRRVVDAGAAVGLAELAGSSSGDENGVVARLAACLGDELARRRLSEKAAALVDGLGTWRVVSAWEVLVAARDTTSRAAQETRRPVELSVRRATEADASALLRWRNDPVTRENSRSSGLVGGTEHGAWLASSLENENRLLLIIADHDGAVGTVRWDRVAVGGWEVSVTLAPERRGQSLARPMLRAGETYLRQAEGDCTDFVAVVREENASSVHLFQSSGYIPDAPVDQAGFLAYRKQVLAAAGQTETA